jgi:hypothetical protein
VAIKLEGPIQDAFNKRARKTQSMARAHAVARRKMCDLVYAILRSGEPCRWATPAAIERKQKEMEVKKDRAERLPQSR